VVIWLIPILLALHNAEEAIAFRGYEPRLPSLVPAALTSLASRLTPAAMVQALTILSLAAFALAVIADTKRDSRRLLWCLLAVQATIGLNVLSHIVIAAFVFRGYAPGLITAVIVNAPFTAYCFRRASREQWVPRTGLRATVPAALVLHGPVLLGALWVVSTLTQ
jgi:hypothetical protein